MNKHQLRKQQLIQEREESLRQTYGTPESDMTPSYGRQSASMQATGKSYSSHSKTTPIRSGTNITPSKLQFTPSKTGNSHTNTPKTATRTPNSASSSSRSNMRTPGSPSGGYTSPYKATLKVSGLATGAITYCIS
jgi:hypothetical protein